jgi:carboxyl-terminal processing protease
MKNKERIIWISTVLFLFIVLLFGVFINEAQAASLTSNFAYFEKFKSVYRTLKEEYVDEKMVDDKKLINGAIKGMIDSIGDKHTMYLSPEDMEDLKTTSSGNFGGIGVVITKKDDYIAVDSLIDDGPAYKKGLKPGDVFITANGVSLKGMKLFDATKILKGEPGTTVKIEFMRNDLKMEVEIRRAIIKLPTVKSGYIEDKYGYLRISEFSGSTDTDVKKALTDFKSKKVKAIVVDLRMNPGGLLESVTKIVNYFQEDGVIVSTIGRNGMNKEVVKASKINNIIPDDIPVIVLIDGNSASASEIFAGAIKDLKRGILIGEKSYGKGSVQVFRQLGDDGFKLTIAKYYTPSGISIDGIGIQPDIEVKEPEFSDDENFALTKLYKNKIIDEFIKKNPTPSDQEINIFVTDIQSKGYNLTTRVLKKMVKIASERTSENKSIYDLDYDLQLNKAIDVLDHDKLEFKDGKYNLKN